MSFDIELSKSCDVGLSLAHANLSNDYREEWNVNSSLNDFLVIIKDGQPVNNCLYRLGGVGTKPDGKNYFMLIKHIESTYTDDDIKKYNIKNKKHLASCWCILDKNGVEKVVSSSFDSLYLVANSCLYSKDSIYYNIETGEPYGRSYDTAIQSSEYIFLSVMDGRNKIVKQIKKSDGSVIIYN